MKTNIKKVNGNKYEDYNVECIQKYICFLKRKKPHKIRRNAEAVHDVETAHPKVKTVFDDGKRNC